jgi:hypothetical protein
MMQNREVKEGAIVINRESGEEVEIFDSKAQLKIESYSNSWVPAVLYFMKGENNWQGDRQMYCRSLEAFMAKFSLPEERKE